MVDAMKDNLELFADWWFANRPIQMIADNHTIYDKNIWGSVLFRTDEYQVQLFICAPNSVIHPHNHPNVDSLEIPHSGDIIFTVGDVAYNGRDYPINSVGTYGVRVVPSQTHHAKIGPSGGSFLSIQKWLNGVNPTSVGDDWSDDQGNTHGICVPVNVEDLK